MAGVKVCLHNSGCCCSCFCIVRKYASRARGLTGKRRDASVGLTFPTAPRMCKREGENLESDIVSIPWTSQTQASQAPFCLRTRPRPCMGFNFTPLSTSVDQLLPAAIYYRQIERIQGVSQLVLTLKVQTGYQKCRLESL